MSFPIYIIAILLGNFSIFVELKMKFTIVSCKRHDNICSLYVSDSYIIASIIVSLISNVCACVLRTLIDIFDVCKLDTLLLKTVK